MCIEFNFQKLEFEDKKFDIKTFYISRTLKQSNIDFGF